MKTNKFESAINYVSDDMILASAKGATLKKKNDFVKWSALTAAFLLLFTGIFAIIIGNTAPTVSAIVAFDVNPSLELEIDADERVIDVKMLNEDARKVIGEMELENVEINTAVNAIIGSMLQNGYISIEKNSILVSVKSDDKAKADELQRIITGDIFALLSSNNIEASVIAQPYDADKEIEQKAEENKISVAKASLIKKVIDAGLKDAAGIPYSYETLAPLNINELKLLIEAKSVEVSGIQSTGSASSDAYISKEAALDIALRHAGLSNDIIKKLESEFDFEKGKMVYEIEFEAENTEYEYEIDAKTGEIVDFEKDIDDDDKDDNYNDDDDDDKITEQPAISKEAALSAALAHAGLNKENVRKIDIELEKKNGVLFYEIDFENGEFEFEYAVSASDGSIINVKKESNLPDDDDNDDYDEDIIAEVPATDKEVALSASLAHASLTKEDVRDIDIELDKKGGILVYEIDFENDEFEFEYKINANDSSIISSKKESKAQVKPDNPGQNDDIITDVSVIGEEAALTAALTHAGVSKEAALNVEIELDDENGVLVYSVDFENSEFEFDYDINATDGSIIKSEKEPLG